MAGHRHSAGTRAGHRRPPGLTGVLGTVAESVDGVFTGRLVGDILHGPGKAHAVRSLAIREGLNLKRCTATYSDSHNDVPMLSLVGKAVAINPDSDLRDVAKIRGWEMYDFRTARKAGEIRRHNSRPSAQPVAEQPSPPASSATAEPPPAHRFRKARRPT